VKNEWTVLTPLPPMRQKTDGTAVSAKKPLADADADLVWRGTLLPQTDADIWLATAFADYHDIVVLEKKRRRNGDPKTAAAKMQESVQEYRTQYVNASKAGEVALADVKSSVTSEDWYLLASAKGVLLLHQLRRDLGAEVFDQAMDDFGMKHGGQRVTSQQFQRHMEARVGRTLEPFFAYWWRGRGLPK
jgi:aminopeptidase N